MKRTITIRQEPDGRLVPIDENGQPADKVKVRTGDEVRWESPHPPVRINFPEGSPFGGSRQIAGFEDHTVTFEGPRQSFTYECGVTIGGRPVGWPDPSAPGSGGEVEVVRRN